MTRGDHPLDARQRVLGAVVVEDQDLAARRGDRPADDVPGADDEVLALGQGRHPGPATGRDDHDVRRQSRDIPPPPPCCAAPPRQGAGTPGQPLHDPDQVPAPRRRPRRQSDLPADLGRRLEQRHRVPPLRRDARRLQPRRPRARPRRPSAAAPSTAASRARSSPRARSPGCGCTARRGPGRAG